MKRIIILIFAILIISKVFASTGGNVEYTCPLCGTQFEAFTQFSYSTFGQNLDLRPWGAAIIPTPIPKCPECNLVFFNNFLNEEELLLLKEELSENNIFSNELNMPNYFYLARVAVIVGKNLENIIYWFLSAVWENRNEDLNNLLINITIDYINKLDVSNDSYNTYQMVKLDLLRRSRQFDEAIELIEDIRANEEFYQGIIEIIISRQTELIENSDIEEHPIPRSN